jgi:hypothetical protein
MTRHPRMRKCQPCVEDLERKELCSVGASTVTTTLHSSTGVPMPAPIQVGQIQPCGTGKGGIIITR